MSQPVLLRAADRIPTPWKNGGGVTREIAAHPAAGDKFEWRISVAEVATAGPFSHFEGIDRTLLVLDGTLDLDLVGDPVRVLAGQAIAFTGETVVKGTPLDGIVTDLNIMVRRTLWRAEIEGVRSPCAAPIAPGKDTTILFFAGDGAARCGARVFDLAAGDALRVDAMADPFIVSSEKAVYVVRLYRSGAPSLERVPTSPALARKFEP